MAEDFPFGLSDEARRQWKKRWPTKEDFFKYIQEYSGVDLREAERDTSNLNVGACIRAGRHSSFERCERCAEFTEIIGPIDTMGLVEGQVFRTKAEPIRYFKVVKA